MAKNVCYRLEFAQGYQDWTIHDWYRVFFSDETMKEKLITYCNGHAWCWVRDENSQLKAHHMSQTVKHRGSAILCGVV